MTCEGSLDGSLWPSFGSDLGWGTEILGEKKLVMVWRGFFSTGVDGRLAFAFLLTPVDAI